RRPAGGPRCVKVDADGPVPGGVCRRAEFTRGVEGGGAGPRVTGGRRPAPSSGSGRTRTCRWRSCERALVHVIVLGSCQLPAAASLSRSSLLSSPLALPPRHGLK